MSQVPRCTWRSLGGRKGDLLIPCLCIAYAHSYCGMLELMHAHRALTQACQTAVRNCIDCKTQNIAHSTHYNSVSKLFDSDWGAQFETKRSKQNNASGNQHYPLQQCAILQTKMDRHHVTKGSKRQHTRHCRGQQFGERQKDRNGKHVTERSKQRTPHD